MRGAILFIEDIPEFFDEKGALAEINCEKQTFSILESGVLA